MTPGHPLHGAAGGAALAASGPPATPTARAKPSVRALADLLVFSRLACLSTPPGFTVSCRPRRRRPIALLLRPHRPPEHHHGPMLSSLCDTYTRTRRRSAETAKRQPLRARDRPRRALVTGARRAAEAHRYEAYKTAERLLSHRPLCSA